MKDVRCARKHRIRPLELAPQQMRAVRTDRAPEIVRVLKRVLDAKQVALRADALGPVRVRCAAVREI